jgi:uncharacterized protein (TIGR03067 family)
MRRYLAAALCLPLVVSLSALADEKPLEGDAKKLQGQWTAKAGPDAIPVYLTFDKGKIAFKVTAPTGDEKTISGDFTLDETASPRAMTWSGMKLGKTDVPGTEAIYVFDGDDTVKIAGGTQARPKEFIEKGKELPGLRPNTMVFTRVKEKEKDKDKDKDDAKK